MRQHFLASYLDALGSLVVAQFIKSKAMEGGPAGVKRLAKMPHICKLLHSNGGLIVIWKCAEMLLHSIEESCLAQECTEHLKYRRKLSPELHTPFLQNPCGQ